MRAFSSIIPIRLRSIAGLSLLILGALAVAGCRADTTSADLLEQNFPPAGQVYMMQLESRADSGARTARMPVVVQASDVIFEGREGVVMFASDSMTSALVYEANGDVSLFVPGDLVGSTEFPSSWVRYPFSGRATSRTDTLLPLRGDERYRLVRQVEFDGTEQMRAADKMISTSRVIVHSRIEIGSDTAATVLSERVQRVWYAPRLQYVVREEVDMRSGGDSTWQYSAERLLVEIEQE